MTNSAPTKNIQELLSYDAHSGIISWRFSCGRVRAGQHAGSRTGRDKDRLSVFVQGRRYEYGRMCWFLHHGFWPQNQIDHVDGNPLNNRIENLRDVTHQANSQNKRRPRKGSKVPLIGVSTSGKRFIAHIRSKGMKTRHLGTFDTPEEAHSAYVLAKRAIHEGCTL